MRRGDICIADLDPRVGAKASKSRPVVVVSNNGANIAAQRSGRGVVTVYSVRFSHRCRPRSCISWIPHSDCT